MTQAGTKLKKIKNKKLKISSLNDFKDALERDGYNIDDFNKDRFREKVVKTFKIDNIVLEKLNQCIEDSDITYRANDVNDFIDYIEKMVAFENYHNKLCKKISEVKMLHINRIEYEREPSIQDDVEHIKKAIDHIKSRVSEEISKEELFRLEVLEKEIGQEYLYAKDIELLKKMVIVKNQRVREEYDRITMNKRISINIPNNIGCEYITPKEGTIEYHQHISSNIPRMKRLIKNIDKYMKLDNEKKSTFKINQSKALQDSINIALATFNKKQFKAISGKNNIVDYCGVTCLEDAFFKSCKVNKLGTLGIGYNRVNDSEKKIFEEIHRQIQAKEVEDKGELILYTKWEPCPSCYYVISQFCKKYSNINVKVKYSKKYGEENRSACC